MTLLPPKIVRYYNLGMLSIVVQAGGQSARMGENKALKPFLGRPLVQRVLERLAPIADELLLTTNQPEDFAFLKLPLFTDIKPGRGPLGGLYTALVSAKYPFVAVVACDMMLSLPRQLKDLNRCMPFIVAKRVFRRSSQQSMQINGG